MKALFVTALMVLSASAFAKTGTPSLVNASPVQISSSDSAFRIESISVTNVASGLKFDPSCTLAMESGSPSNYGCYVATSTTDAVQVVVSYDSGDPMSDDSSAQREVNLPVSLFTASELAQIKASRDYVLDPIGQKTKANQALANALVKISTQTSQVQSPVVQCVKPGVSDADDGIAICDQYATTGTELVDVKTLSVTRR